MNPIPTLERNRDIYFEKDTLEKFLYLEKVKGKGNKTSICNEALKEFFEVEFKKLKIEHYINLTYESEKIMVEKRHEEYIRARDDQRLLKLAKARIILKEMEKIKEEETKSGKKIEMELPKNIKEYNL